MNTQFLSSVTLNKYTFTHFCQRISPEDYQRINKAIVSPLMYQTQSQNVPPNWFGRSIESQVQTEETEPIRSVLKSNTVDQFGKAEYQEELDMEHNGIKIELNNSGENRIGWAKQEAVVKFEGFGPFSETTSKSEEAFPKQDIITDKLPMITHTGSLNLSDYLRKELEIMVSYILQSMGTVGQTEIENMRSHFYNNKCLLQIYDKLVVKYFSARRCREDIVRYILRRAFREVRAPIMKAGKLSVKKANLAVCKKYFHKTFEELERSGKEINNEEELLEQIMPYTKKSKNRTMNTTFVQEVFASKEFYEDYQVFLGQFDEMLAEDNNKKVEQLLEFLMDCIKKDTLDKIGNYKRLPWLDTWIQKTKDIAFSLATYKKSQKHHFKKNKI